MESIATHMNRGCRQAELLDALVHCTSLRSTRSSVTLCASTTSISHM